MDQTRYFPRLEEHAVRWHFEGRAGPADRDRTLPVAELFPRGVYAHRTRRPKAVTKVLLQHPSADHPLAAEMRNLLTSC
jgi:hypothetical protein